MADPFAPPEAPRDRRHRPATAYNAPAAPVTTTTYGAEEVPVAGTRPLPTRPTTATAWRDDRDTRDDHRMRDRVNLEPARPGPFWIVAGIGIGLVLLARLVWYFTVAGDLPDGLETPTLFSVLGVITLSAGLALAGLLQRGLATPWRIALVLGAGFFALAGDAWLGFDAFFA